MCIMEAYINNIINSVFIALLNTFHYEVSSKDKWRTSIVRAFLLLVGTALKNASNLIPNRSIVLKISIKFPRT